MGMCTLSVYSKKQEGTVETGETCETCENGKIGDRRDPHYCPYRMRRVDHIHKVKGQLFSHSSFMPRIAMSKKLPLDTYLVNMISSIADNTRSREKMSAVLAGLTSLAGPIQPLNYP